MASFADLTARLNLNIQNFASNMRRASTMTNQFASNLKGQINNGLVDSAKKSKFEFKDVSRIVQGIIISKVFYSGLNAIRNCADATWEFTQQLEYAKIAYSNLFNDSGLAEEFINVLKDFAATTPFSFQESEAAAKRLLAYGIQYKNVMYVMQGVLAASSMQNNPQVIESVSRALGQIYTKGRLMNEEMRQLAEAGIPAYEILQQKLGLTSEQLQNLGREGIPASKAINALVDGMTERFGGVVTASTKTMQGIVSNIKDNATMIASGIIQPFYNGIKAVLNRFGEFLANLRNIYETSGLGGLFEAIFPPEMHGTIRLFAANISALVQSILRLVGAVGSLLGPVLNALINVFNAFAPILTTVINILSTMIKWITENATAMKILTAMLAAAATMWVVFKIKALAATVVAGVCTLISKALAGLSAMLTFVAAHPFWAMLIAIAGIVVGLSGGFGKLSDAISGYFKKLTSFNGVDADKLLLPSQEERANDLNKFNEALDGTSDSMDDLADSTGKATKAAKGLLSFDEVFKLNQPDEGTDSGIVPDFDFEMPDFSGLSDALIPEMEDFEGIADTFVNNLIDGLKEKILGAGIGAIIGGLLGGILGGPLGAKIGAIAGAIAGWFWDDLAEALGLTEVGKVALPIATGLGAIIGAIAGGPLGAVIGTAIGGLVGWLIESIARGVETGDWSGVALPAGIGIGAAIGMIAGGPAGAAIGAAIGGLVGWIGQMLIDGFTKGEWNPQALGLGLGTGIGAAIGMIAGGPAGAAIGAAVGALVGWLGGLIVDNWGVISQWFVDVGTAIADWAVGVWNSITTWVVNTATAIADWAVGIWNAVTTWVVNTATAIANWAVNTWNSITTWVSNTWNAITTWVVNTATAIANWAVNTWNSITNWVTNTWNTITNWVTNTATAIANWAVNTWNTITNWVTNTWNAITNWVTNTATAIGNWATNTWNTITNWCNNTWNSFTGWCNNLWNSLTSWFSNVGSTISSWLSNIWSSVTNWFSNLGSTISNWFSNLLQIVGNGLSNIWNSITNWISNLWSNIWGQLTNIGSRISSWWDNLWSGKSANVSVNASGTGSWSGHASGGVFNREHVARFAEGNKAEAIIPLENESAMQPFVDAVSNGLTASLMPIVANLSGGQSQLQPLYVGTLIADDSGLKELERKMRIIRIKEERRGG